MADPEVQEHVFLIEVNKITPNPFQPRREFDMEQLQELAGSIRDHGILQPLVVSRIEEVTELGTSVHYQLIAGERRFRAAQLAGLDRVPAVIKHIGLERERLELAIIENVQRANLNPIESARAYNRLADEFKLTQREIATQIGKSREVIANTMRLLNLPNHMQEAVGSGKLGESQARLLLSVDDIQQQELLFQDILKNNSSVRELKNKIDYFKAVKHQQEVAATMPTPDPESESLKRQLEEALGTPVELKKEGESSKVTIQFNSPADLYALIKKLQQKAEVAPIQQASLDNFTV